jgi:hypothetical protein
MVSPSKFQKMSQMARKLGRELLERGLQAPQKASTRPRSSGAKGVGKPPKQKNCGATECNYTLRVLQALASTLES